MSLFFHFKPSTADHCMMPMLLKKCPNSMCYVTTQFDDDFTDTPLSIGRSDWQLNSAGDFVVSVQWTSSLVLLLL